MLNWFYLSLGALIVLVIVVFILYLKGGSEKKEYIPTPTLRSVPDGTDGSRTFSGTAEANKPVVGYKHPCKYCGKLIPPNSTACPFCGKINPLGPYRCPRCHEPVEKDWQVCPKCNQNLRIVCPYCGKNTFFGDYCENCGARLLVKCPSCGQEQPPISDKCIRCGKPNAKIEVKI